jgi:hypothetical protein
MSGLAHSGHRSSIALSYFCGLLNFWTMPNKIKTDLEGRWVHGFKCCLLCKAQGLYDCLTSLGWQSLKCSLLPTVLGLGLPPG